MAARPSRAQSAPNLAGTLIIGTDLPAPMRSWFEVWDGQPTLWVRWDLLTDLLKIIDAHRLALAAPHGA